MDQTEHLIMNNDKTRSLQGVRGEWAIKALQMNHPILLLFFPLRDRPNHLKLTSTPPTGDDFNLHHQSAS